MIIHNALQGNVIFTNHTINGNVENTNHTIAGDVINNGMRSVSDYHGVYEVTPNASTQILSTSNKRMEHDVTINPIPSNYGLITYDGSGILIS